MGKVVSRLNRQFYRFNAENRAHREISKEKPIPAPRHATEEKLIKEILEETQDVKEQMLIKDKVLDNYLKNVFVVSHGGVEEKRMKPSEKGMLPLSRAPPEETELGYYEPEIIPKGKLTLKQIMKILADNQGNPQLYNASKVSEDYKISQETAGNLLEYFSSYKVFINEQPRKLTGRDKILGYISPSKNVNKALPDKSEGPEVKLKASE